MSDNTNNPIEEIVSEEDQIDAIFAEGMENPVNDDNVEDTGADENQTDDTLETDEDNTPSEEEGQDDDIEEVEDDEAEDETDDESENNLENEGDEETDKEVDNEIWDIEDLETNQVIRLADGTETTVQGLIDGQMMQSDYTKKTQALADERKEIETLKETVMQQAELATSENEKIAIAWQDELQDAENAFRANPIDANLKQRYDIATVNFNAAVKQYDDSESVHKELRQERLTTQINQANEYASEHIEGWNQDMARDLVGFAVEQTGVPQEQLMDSITGPALHIISLAMKQVKGEKVATQKRSIAKKTGKSLKQSASKAKPVSKKAKSDKQDAEAIKRYEQSGDVEDLLKLF